jgi:hypothetical protein
MISRIGDKKKRPPEIIAAAQALGRLGQQMPREIRGAVVGAQFGFT